LTAEQLKDISKGMKKGGFFKMTDIGNSPAPEKKRIPINEKLFRLPASGEKPHLSGVKCKSCGEFFFPERTRCTHCFAEEMEPVAFSTKGKLYSYTIVHHATPGYTGPLPYAVGAVELPEGLVILSPLTQVVFEELKIGIPVELVIEKLCENETGDEVFSYKFKPC
jgi:uncharacterized protein